MAESQRMKLDVNNKKTSLKSKNHQKEKVKYFKKTKSIDDNLRIRVGRNRGKIESANKYNPHKATCIFDDTPNDMEDIIIYKDNSDITYKLTQIPRSNTVSKNFNNKITKSKNTSNNDNRMDLNKSKKEYLNIMIYQLYSINIEMTGKPSVYFSHRHLHPKLYDLNNKKSVKRELLINNELETTKEKFEQKYFHAVSAEIIDAIPRPVVYFEGNKSMLNPIVPKFIPKPISSFKIISVKNANRVSVAPPSNNDSLNSDVSNTIRNDSQLSLKKPSENEVMAKQIEQPKNQLSVINPVSSNNSVVKTISTNNQVNNKLIHTNPIESQLSLKKPSENEVMAKQIQERKDKLSVTSLVSSDYSMSPTISPDNIINEFVDRKLAVIGLNYLRRPPAIVLLRMLEDNPNYLELLFEKNTTGLSNIHNSRIFHNDIFMPTYYTDSFLKNKYKRNICINNYIISWDEFLVNLNRYIADCKILNLSNLFLDDKDVCHLADNLSNNKTLLYLIIKLNYIIINNIEYFSRAILSNSTLLAIRFEIPLHGRVYREILLNNDALSNIKISLYLNNYIRLCSIEQRLKQIFENYSEGNDIDLSNAMLCDDGAKHLANYLLKLDCIIPKLNLKNNYITFKGWQYICYSLFNFSTQELKCLNIIFEHGNFDIYFPKVFFNDMGFSNPYLFYSYSVLDEQDDRLNSSYNIGQKNFNWNCSSGTLILDPRLELLPIVDNRPIMFLTDNFLGSYSKINHSIYGNSLWLSSSQIFLSLPEEIFKLKFKTTEFKKQTASQIFLSLSEEISKSNSKTGEFKEHTASRRTYQKNIRATFFYNTSGRKAEHQQRHAPTKPNVHIRKVY